MALQCTDDNIRTTRNVSEGSLSVQVSLILRFLRLISGHSVCSKQCELQMCRLHMPFCNSDMIAWASGGKLEGSRFTYLAAMNMHKFSADHIHVMCNIQDCPLRTLKALDFSVAYINDKCFSTKLRHRQWRCEAAVRVSFNGSCSRCLTFSLLPCPALPSNLYLYVACL
jgi:hypothetical protein